jgi:hypothetical protein
MLPPFWLWMGGFWVMRESVVVRSRVQPSTCMYVYVYLYMDVFDVCLCTVRNILPNVLEAKNYNTVSCTSKPSFSIPSHQWTSQASKSRLTLPGPPASFCTATAVHRQAVSSRLNARRNFLTKQSKSVPCKRGSHHALPWKNYDNKKKNHASLETADWMTICLLIQKLILYWHFSLIAYRESWFGLCVHILRFLTHTWEHVWLLYLSCRDDMWGKSSCCPVVISVTIAWGWGSCTCS